MALGAVKPWVAASANIIITEFGVGTVYGYNPGGTWGEHPLGLAVDFMVYSDKAKGDAIAAFAQANHASHSIYYIIWYQRIWNVTRAGEGWRTMSDRGSVTQNHKDHVHISYLSSPSGSPPAEGSGGSPTGSGGFGYVFTGGEFLAAPAQTIGGDTDEEPNVRFGNKGKFIS
jgi:hypothetical protein